MRLSANNAPDRYIGDSVKFKGQHYLITGNYPRHGYLLLRLRRATGERVPQSFRLSYRELV